MNDKTLGDVSSSHAPKVNTQSGNDAMQALLHSTLIEQRRKRRWGIFFKSIYILIFLFIIASVSIEGPPGADKKSHTAVIDIKGVIMDGADSNADNIASALQSAFKNKNAKAVIMRINSPGGSPVQSGYIYDEIQRLRSQSPEKKVYAVCVDACASGAYYIASAADEIYAAPSSIVGSIGVYMGGFGFVDTIKKLGVERRLLTAGKNKGFLDPFTPLKPQQEEHAQGLIDEVHTQFIDAVVKGRGDKLKQDKDLFSGLIWSGQRAQQLGLVDGIGSTGFVMREIVKEPNGVDYTVKQDLFSRFSKMFSKSIVDGFSSRIQEHSHQLS